MLAEPRVCLSDHALTHCSAGESATASASREVADYNYLPDTQSLSERLRSCLQVRDSGVAKSLVITSRGAWAYWAVSVKDNM
jgi:hypothetical protein